MNHALRRVASLLAAVFLVSCVFTAVSVSTAAPAYADDNDCSFDPRSWDDCVKKPVDAVTGFFSKWNPANLPEIWAKSAGESAGDFLAKVGSTTSDLAKPDLTAGFWLRQYAISEGLALIALAFLLLFVTARMSNARGPDTVMLMRTVGFRLQFVVPAMLLGPAVLGMFVNLAYGLADGYSKAGSAEAGDAIRVYQEKLVDVAGPQGFVGGALSMLLVFGATAVLGLFVYLELLISGYGVYLAGLLIPFALVFYVYPPAKQLLAKLSGILVGLLLVPPLTFLAFNLLWGMVKGVAEADGPEATFQTAVYVLVAMLATAAFPILTAWLVSTLTGDGPAHHAWAGAVSGPIEGAGSDGVQGIKDKLGRGDDGSRRPSSTSSPQQSTSGPAAGGGSPGGAPGGVEGGGASASNPTRGGGPAGGAAAEGSGAAAGGSAAGAGAGAGSGAAAAAGPAGIAVAGAAMAAQEVTDTVRSASRDTASGVAAQAGAADGGSTSGHGQTSSTGMAGGGPADGAVDGDRGQRR